MLLLELLLALAVVVALRVRAEELAIGRHPQPDQSSESPDAVEPGELLSLLPAPRVVVDRHLVDPIPESQRARRDVRLDLEAVAIEVQTFPELGPQDLVAGL